MSELEQLIGEAIDLMASQQAMPDDGSLRRLGEIVGAAYRLGQADGSHSAASDGSMVLVPREQADYALRHGYGT